MNQQLIELMNSLNSRLFAIDILEYRYGLGESDRLAIKKEYNNKQFRDSHHFDDLYEVGLNNALFSDRAIIFISEIASSLGLDVKFHYRQCFRIVGGN